MKQENIFVIETRTDNEDRRGRVSQHNWSSKGLTEIAPPVSALSSTRFNKKSRSKKCAPSEEILMRGLVVGVLVLIGLTGGYFLSALLHRYLSHERRRNERCPYCKGKGERRVSPDPHCPECHGAGFIYVSDAHDYLNRNCNCSSFQGCPDCGTTGQVNVVYSSLSHKTINYFAACCTTIYIFLVLWFFDIAHF